MNISIIGTGYIAQRFIKLLPKYPDIKLDYVLTRREIDQVWAKIPKVTRCPEAIVQSDIIVDFSNDAKYLYKIIKEYCSNSKIVTFNSEFHVTYPNINQEFPSLKITEGEGDQPGSFAKLANRIRELDFDPKVFINKKRFLDYNPAPNSMKKWADYYGLSERITVSSTDGTKVSFETAFIANAFNLTVPIDSKLGMYYKEQLQINDKSKLAYVQFSKDKGISIIAKATKQAKIKDLSYLGVSIDKGWSEFSIPYHLCQYDIVNTIRDLYYRNEILLNASFGKPIYNVYAVSKTWLAPGDIIKIGVGGYDVRGEIKEIEGNEKLLPIIDCENVKIITDEISPGTLITTDMVEPIKD